MLECLRKFHLVEDVLQNPVCYNQVRGCGNWYALHIAAEVSDMLLTAKTLTAEVKSPLGHILEQYSLDIVHEVHWHQAATTTSDFKNSPGIRLIDDFAQYE